MYVSISMFSNDSTKNPFAMVGRFFVFVRWLEATKHFLCNCNTCSLSLDPVRGFRCLGRLPVFLLGQWYDTPCTVVHPPKFNSSPLKIGPNPEGKVVCLPSIIVQGRSWDMFQFLLRSDELSTKNLSRFLYLRDEILPILYPFS